MTFHKKGGGRGQFCGHMYKDVSKTHNFSVTEGEGGSVLGQICIKSFMNDPSQQC